MKRPWPLRILPDRLRMSAWARYYRGRHAQWRELYDSAALRFAPQVHMELLPGDIISDCIAFTGIYELSVTRRVVELAQRGGTLIDVGANLGYFALLWAAVNPRNKCIALEASPRNIEFLGRNLSRNRLDGQVTVVARAAGAAAGRLRFSVGSADQTGWGGFAPEDQADTIEVDVVRVDDIVRSDEPIALLKIDIEGADTWALKGCDRLLQSRAVEEIWYEQNKPRMRALSIPLTAAEEYLRSVGYAPLPQGDASADIVEWTAVPQEKAQR